MTDHAKTVAQLEAENERLRMGLTDIRIKLMPYGKEIPDEEGCADLLGWIDRRVDKALASTGSEAAEVLAAALTWEAALTGDLDDSVERLREAVIAYKLAGDTQSKEA